MKRVAAICTVLACGSAQTPAQVVSVATVDASAPTQHVAPLALPGPAFQLIVKYRTCALVHGKIHCRDSILSDKPLATEPVLPGLEKVDVTSASFGRDYACVTTRAGEVECFGGNHFGQLGANVRADNHAAPLVLPNLHGVKRVVAGPMHACAILGDGHVSCWGKNQNGETGSSTNYLEAARELVEPEVVAGPSDVAELALGWGTTCAVATNGHAWCWGRAKLAEQRHGSSDSDEHPTVMPSLEGMTSLTANEESFCGVKDEKVVCWGDMMMIDRHAQRDTLDVLPIPHAVKVSLGSSHACALDAAGAVYCFGSNMEGELGVPPVKDVYEPLPPQKIRGIPRATDVAVGASMSCAVTTSNEVFCWGRFSWEKEDIRGPVRIAVL